MNCTEIAQRTPAASVAGLGASPGWICKIAETGASALYLAGLGASPGWISEQRKPWSIALYLVLRQVKILG